MANIFILILDEECKTRLHPPHCHAYSSIHLRSTRPPYFVIWRHIISSFFKTKQWITQSQKWIDIFLHYVITYK